MEKRIVFNYSYDDLIEPTFDSIKQLGGSATINEIIEKLIEMLKLTDAEVEDIDRGSTTKLVYRCAWARTYLKKAGYIVNSSRGVWSLSDTGATVNNVSKNEVKEKVKNSEKDRKKSITEPSNSSSITDIEDTDIDDLNWQSDVLEVVQSITPEQFERLCQRLLRELGFVNVEVLGKSHDGGIDGKGILKIGKVLSFHVAFQSKRYSNSVGAPVVRDFRGAIMGRADKGLLITTGSFTREAKKEAQRDGATPIDLIDGNELAEHLKELELGVEVVMVESIKIKNDWFKNI